MKDKFICLVMILWAVVFILLTGCTKDRYTVWPGQTGTSDTSHLMLNEFMASNGTTIANPDAPGSFDDWIEIYNPTNTDIDLAGYYLTDSLADKTKCQIPSGNPITIIPAHGYKIIWADNTPTRGPLHTSFALSKNGEALGLTSPQSVMLDSITFAIQVTDVSVGRVPDGSSLWKSTTSPTPGTANH